MAAGLAILLLLSPSVGARQKALPASLSDADFWALSERLSEPGGAFQSDNLVSNEMTLSTVAAALSARVKPGGVYLGVGPEQNFTYIAAMRPRMAFITDIRRGNLHMHLMYKALFHLSADRADFFGRLFTKVRPDGLTTASTAADLMNAYWDAPTSEEGVFRRNLREIQDVLVKTHGFPLSPDDLKGVEYVYHSFYWYGPRITYSSSGAAGLNARGASYADLMMQRDVESGAERTYLASEDGFRFLKDLQRRNLVVPVVGDFAGPKALRAVGQYVRDHAATVSAFYVSNVEQYLTRNGVWPAFCANVATMPLEEGSVFIRPGFGGRMTISYGVRGSTGASSLVLLNGVPVAGSAVPAMIRSLSADQGRNALAGIMGETAGCR
jgi:hypothetical protein